MNATFDIRRDDALTVADLNTDIDRLLQVAESFSGDSASAMLREVPSLVAKLDCCASFWCHESTSQESGGTTRTALWNPSSGALTVEIIVSRNEIPALLNS